MAARTAADSHDRQRESEALQHKPHRVIPHRLLDQFFPKKSQTQTTTTWM
jgi:hypothetical protein